MQDEIIEEVERIREEIARRHDFDIDRIFQTAKDRRAKRQEAEQCRQMSENETEGVA